MPFQDGVYYPYRSETQGTHSSAGIPSLLNSPLSAAPAGMTPSSNASTFVPFRFRPRRGSVDWRRINAVDVDLVVSQLDVDALQEHISAVTFCSLDGERCQRCQSPVDPALIKLLQLAQLMVEWLLHCQEFLSLNLQAAEERLVAAGREREQLLARLGKQEEKAKSLTVELKQRKKIICTQQSLLAPRIISSHKCLHCDKSFLNSTFLQNHMQRRHPEEYQIQLQSDGEKKSQIESLKQEISSLKEQIVQQQQALQTKIAEEKEQQNMHKELQRELERFKAEEMARMDRKIEDSRDGMRREMEFLYNRNIQALSEASQSSKKEKPVSPVSTQPERDVDTYREMQLQAIQKLEQQMKKQGSTLIHQKVDPPTEGQRSPVSSFIVLEQFNAIRLVQSIHQSLAALSKVIRGTQLLTPEVQKLATALLNQECPLTWQNKWEGPEDPMQYLRAIVTRSLAIQSWVERAGRQALLSDILDLSELFHPDTFLNALRQETARSMGCSMDSLVFVSSWKSPIAQAKLQVKVGGLQLEGCRFDGTHLSENQHDSPSVSAVPPCYMAWVPQTSASNFAASAENIWLPLYTSSERVKVVTHVSLPCGANSNQWIQTGAALFLKQQ